MMITSWVDILFSNIRFDLKFNFDDRVILHMHMITKKLALTKPLVFGGYEKF